MARPANLLVLQDELEDLLKRELQHVGPTVHVFTPADLAGEAKEDSAAAKQPTPAVNIVYLGHKPSLAADRQRADGKAAVIAQLFALEVVTRNVRAVKTGAAARADGGALAMNVLAIVMGARLPSAAGPVQLVPGPGPVYRNGMQHLPLLVQVDLMVTK